MDGFSKILVAVKNPDARHQPGVEKALHIAAGLGASVELFHALSSAVFLELQPLNSVSLPALRREAQALRLASLEKIAARKRRRGVRVSCAVEWDYPPHEAIVRRAEAIGADLIIAECHQGRRLSPWLLHLTDWELLRTSRMPVLLLKNGNRWREPVVLAAVDPSHAHAKPTRLDAGIVAQATRITQALKGRLELVHANSPSGFGFMLGDPAIGAQTVAIAYEQLLTQGRERFEKFARKAGVPQARQHLVDREPQVAIPHVARKIGAHLVVMGAVSRSGLKRVFIGNTAEKVLGSLPCDVLVIKPTRSRRRIATRPRGMRVVAPLSYPALTA
jgi:universal stress protein E